MKMKKVYFTVSTSSYDSKPLPLGYWKTVEAVVDDLIEQGLKAYVTVEYLPETKEE
jgi:hypothetical protein